MRPRGEENNIKRPAIIDKLEGVMRQDISRKQFIMLIGAGFASLFGLSALLGALTKPDTSSRRSGPDGYGMRNYGP